MMKEIFDIATNISTPLMLAGFLSAAFFLTIRQILTKNIFPELTKQMSTAVILMVINRLFTLALIAMILGFISFALGKFYPGETHKEPILIEERVRRNN